MTKAYGVSFSLTHWSRATHLCVNKLEQHWLRLSRVACSSPSHYLIQSWIIVFLTLAIYSGIWANCAYLRSRKCTWKCRLQNCGHFSRPHYVKPVTSDTMMSGVNMSWSGPCLDMKAISPAFGIRIIKIRRSWDRVIFLSYLSRVIGLTQAEKSPLTITEAKWRIICVSKLSIIGSDNGLLPGQRQTIIWTNAGVLFIWPLETNFSEIVIKIKIFKFKKGRWKCLGNGGHFVSASIG